jgi:hypothetical protein
MKKTEETRLIKTWEIPKNFVRKQPFDLPIKGKIPPTIKRIGINRILERKVLDVVQYLGSYGMGGPGFFGILLEKSKKYPEEWLVLRLWGAADWLHFNDRIIGCHPKQEEKWKPYGADNVKIILIGNSIKSATINMKSCIFRFLNSFVLELKKNPKTRPVYGGSREPRVLAKNDDLRQAWIITSRSLAV